LAEAHLLAFFGKGKIILNIEGPLPNLSEKSGNYLANGVRIEFLAAGLSEYVRK
jgi:hypothetical protein